MKHVTATKAAIVIAMIAIVALQIALQATIPLSLPPEPVLAPGVISFVRMATSLQAALFLLMLPMVALMEKRGHICARFRYAILGLMAAGALAAAVCSHLDDMDLYYYIAYGRKLAILHLTPYTPLYNVAADPIISLFPKTWFFTPALYGPAAILIFSLLNLVSPPELLMLVVTFKLAWFLLFLVFAWLTAQLLKSCTAYPYLRWFILCANPMIWMFCLRNGHLEVMVLTLLVLSLWLMQKRQWLVGGFALGALCGTKIIMLAVAPFFLWSAFAWGNWKRALLVLAGCLAFLVPAYVAFNGGELAALYQFGNNNQHCPQLISFGINKIVYESHIDWLMKKGISDKISNLVFVIGAAVMFLSVARTRKAVNLARISGAIMLFFWLTRPYTQAWYILWGAVPFILGARSVKELLCAAVFLTIYAALFSIQISWCSPVNFTLVCVIFGVLFIGFRRMVATAPE